MKSKWKQLPLGELAEIKPNKREIRRELTDDANVSFVPMECLNVRNHNLANHETRPLGDVYGKYTYFRDGDVLLAKITPCFENGKLGIARGLINRVGFGSSEFFVIRPNGKALAHYIYHYLDQQSVRDAGKRVMTGAVGHKRVPKEFLQALPMPLPPLEEQRQIVAVLDEAFKGLDRARAHAETNLRDTNELFDSFLSAVFCADAQNWPTVTLLEIAENMDRVRVPITKKDRMPGDVPYYGASGVVDHVADFLFNEDLLLVSEDGANLLARSYPIAFSISGKSWVNNHAHVFRFQDSVTQEYIRLYLNSISVAPYVRGMAQPKLNQSSLNRIPIPFPSESGRAEIVGHADLISAETEQLAEEYQASLKGLDDLRQALLQRAFAGELT